jgi:L-fuculose-phosphate aldolase
MLNVHKIKQEICEIGDRLYKKGFAAANDGNISYRVSENEVVCTPTMISKGFMKPDDLCVVDMDGNQVSGRRKRTSEIKLHLAIMKRRPEVKSVVHCHPPHATAFGIAREPVPQCVLPEVEIFLGDVPIARYETPGGQDFADTILPFVDKSNVIILANHGTVSWGETVEKAYWWTEVLDAYCRMLMLARGLGRVNYFTEPEAQALLDLKQQWGFQDPRNEMQNCDICANDVFRNSWQQSGVQPTAFKPPNFRSRSASEVNGSAGNSANPGSQMPAGNNPGSNGNASTSAEQEALIQAITDRVMQALSQQS